MRFTLVESIEEKKVSTIPEIDRWLLDRRARRSNGRMQLVTLPIKTLVDDNNLLNDTSMACRRDFIWGNDPKNYHYKDYLTNWTSTPITVKKVDGKYRITDGHHRVMALYNDGYEEAEVVLEESNKMNEDANAETDSDGNPLSKEQIEFFKDSKIRDKQGRLLVCYHASDADFDEFDKSKIRGCAWGSGFYFSSVKEDACEFGAKARPFYLNAKKVFRFFDYDEVIKIAPYLEQHGVDIEDMEIGDKKNGFFALCPYDYKGGKCNKIIDDAIKSLGYDAKHTWENEYAVFDPNQIKSITNKNPTNSNNINEEN